MPRMPRRWTGLLIGAVLIGGVVALQRRRRPRYPYPETLILQPELLEDREDGYQRHIRLQGTINFRDLGGYRTDDGKRVRWGRLYRSGSLGGLQDADLTQLEALKIRLICDLRHIREVEAEADRIPAGSIYWHVPLDTDDKQRSRRRMRTLLWNPSRLGELLLETYTEVMLDGNALLFGDILRRLSEPDNLPALIHCTAGKDRTGVTAMLLLRLLNVPEETIIADYTLSNLYYANYLSYATKAIERYQWMGIRGDDMYPLLVAESKTIQAALTHLSTKYGGVEAYLRNQAGLDTDVFERLRLALLEDVPSL